MKRAIALLLAAAMAITILASCGTNEKQAYLNAMIEGTGFSGVVLVTKNGKTVCESAKGTENKFSNKKITADTKFCIGSVSKQFAAAAILLLRQDGQLSVDDKLSKYFPDYRYGNELTIRHLPLRRTVRYWRTGSCASRWNSSLIRRLSIPTQIISCWRASSRSFRVRATTSFCASASSSRSE